MPKLRNTTLLFLVKETEGKIGRICLAMKKRGFGQGRWNGAGGKVKAGEIVAAATKREALEEIGIKAQKMKKVAELSFFFPHNSAWNQKVHVYFCSQWANKLGEGEEMKPKWFPVKRLPFKKMWPDDIFWLPQVLQGKFVKAKFVFGEGDVIEEKEVRVIKKKQKTRKLYFTGIVLFMIMESGISVNVLNLSAFLSLVFIINIYSPSLVTFIALDLMRVRSLFFPSGKAISCSNLVSAFLLGSINDISIKNFSPPLGFSDVQKLTNS